MDEIEYMSPSKCVFKKTNEPWIYLKVGGEWYCYDPAKPPLGGGAMGTVYLGYRVSNSSPVAVKRVKDTFANNSQIRERARQEASLAFRHPNLIEILGFCLWDDDNGPFFILSNFVQGEGVKSFVANFDGQPDRTERIVDMMLPTLDALSYIHSRGVVHRDIKPSNIMVENGSNVRLMDLGIARMNGGNKFSSFGFIGTPQYAAPEQILRTENPAPGEAREINASTDIYALGITIYELLAGKNPFDRPTNDEVLASQMTESLPAHPAIPKPLMRVLQKATKKDQTERYQTAEEFKIALQQAMSPDAQKFDPMTWVKENTIVVATGAAAIAVAVAAILLI